MSIEITYQADWRAQAWDTEVASRPAWFVSCTDHPKLGKSNGEPWGYAAERLAKTVRTRHIRAYHRPRTVR